MFAVAGDRTRVTRVTGGNTYHYTTTTFGFRPKFNNKVINFNEPFCFPHILAWRFAKYLNPANRVGFISFRFFALFTAGSRPKSDSPPMAKPSRGRRPSPPSGSASSRSRSRSSGSDSSSRSRSVSRSRSPSRSRSISSSSPSRSASSGSRSPRPPRKSPAEVAKRGRSPPAQVKKASPPPRKASPVRESLTLHVDSLSRNVHVGHLREIFSVYGEVANVDLAMDRVFNLPRGFGYVEYKVRADAEKALLYMDGGQIDGKIVRVRFTLPPRQQKVSPPAKPVASAPKREIPKTDGASADVDKDGPKRPRERMPSPDSPPPRRRLDSPPRRRVDSPPFRRGETPPRRRPASPGAKGRSSSPPPRRYRSPPRNSPRRVRGSPVRRRSPLPPRRRSPPPRRARSPPRRSPLRRRSRSPIRRPLRSRSRSLSPRRDRGPAARRGRSSSYSDSPSPVRKVPRKISRSRSPKRPLRGRSSSNSSSSSSPPRKP
ncbi:unnamed protein product [Linum tenue]|uniref:RRM domain-containing protein n=1 Tax=Linum tenue TaxID=586396 RepID=A0AAV0MVD3_9ROSI|nr:unnamed protein product [Linum tenue]